MNIEQKFHNAMVNIYVHAKKDVGYQANRFLEMVSNEGGLSTAKKLIMKPGGSDGFTKLWELGRLDLTVEALVLNEEYKELFEEKELQICRNRLSEYGFENFK